MSHLDYARRPNLHHRHVVRVEENLCVMPFCALAMDGDCHGKQLQAIDMISAEGGRRVKPFLTEHCTKPHVACISSKPKCRHGDRQRREESLPVPAGQEFHSPRNVCAGRHGEADVVCQGRDHHGQINKLLEENAVRRKACRSATAAPSWCISATSAMWAGKLKAAQVYPEVSTSPEERSPG